MVITEETRQACIAALCNVIVFGPDRQCEAAVEALVVMCDGDRHCAQREIEWTKTYASDYTGEDNENQR